MHKRQGFGYCEDTAKAAAEMLGISKDGVLLGSTGVIGKQMPMDKLIAGVEVLAGKKNDSIESGNEAAKAIMTTDTCEKELAIEIEAGGKTVTIGGMAKGSGMIHPNMCTKMCIRDRYRQGRRRKDWNMEAPTRKRKSTGRFVQKIPSTLYPVRIYMGMGHFLPCLLYTSHE